MIIEFYWFSKYIEKIWSLQIAIYHLPNNFKKLARSSVILWYHCLFIVIGQFVHKRKNEQTSCSVFDGKPLLCHWLRFTYCFLANFLGWLMLVHPQSTTMDHGGPQKSDLSIDDGDKTTSPQLPHCVNQSAKKEKPLRIFLHPKNFIIFFVKKTRLKKLWYITSPKQYKRFLRNWIWHI